MRKRTARIFGFISIALGVFLLLNSFQGITGFFILKNIDKTSGSIVGMVLVIGGVLLLMGKRGRINRLESEAGVSLNINKPFESAIKKHDLGKIDRALAKIGTGKGSEHRLKGQLAGHYSIDAGEGERVIFDYDNPQHSSATPIDYLSDHDYKRLQR